MNPATPARRALVVDDSSVVRRLVAHMMRECGFEVLEAGNGEEACARLRSDGSTEVALVDWNMPVMAGLEFVRCVRADPAHAAMKMVVMTTDAEASQVRSALEAGADAYTTKPFSKDTIQRELRRIGVG